MQRGDGNNKFFYNSCKGRWNSNKIFKLQDDQGISHTSHKDISTTAVSYFEHLVGSTHQVDDFPDDFTLNQLTSDQADGLLMPFTAEDVFSTMKLLWKNRSPGQMASPWNFI